MLEYEENIPDRSGDVAIACKMFDMLVNDDVEYIGWKFGIFCVCI